MRKVFLFTMRLICEEQNLAPEHIGLQFQGAILEAAQKTLNYLNQIYLRVDLQLRKFLETRLETRCFFFFFSFFFFLTFQSFNFLNKNSLTPSSLLFFHGLLISIFCYLFTFLDCTFYRPSFFPLFLYPVWSLQGRAAAIVPQVLSIIES